MPVVNEYALGAPCWFELATTAQSAAKEFYSALLGWSILDSPMGPDQYYTMFQLNGKDVAAAYQLGAQQIEKGIPPHWNVYFSAPNVDETTAKVQSLGGTILQPPFDVMTVGRMSICKDPGGAVFSLWQSNQHKGADIMGENNTVCWSELATWDAPKARNFYTSLFGWQTKGAENMATYFEFSVGGQPMGGLLPMDEKWKDMPSHWGIYFMVEDCDAAVAKAKQLGATVIYGPHSAPGVGRMAGLHDPQGAEFSMITLERKA